MGKKLILILAFLSLTFELNSATNVICYHGTWSQYRLGNGKFTVSDTPVDKCTHYIYSFVGLDSTTNTVKLLDDWLDIGLKGFANAVGLKQQNPNIKVLLAIGGWNEGSAKFSAMAASETSRNTFVKSVLEVVQTYGFDGFDLDWEYPGKRDSSNAADKENFSALIKELHSLFAPLNLILTAAVSATPASADISYDVPALSKYLDSINIMTYDFHGSWDTVTGHNAPLYNTARLAGTEYADYSGSASLAGWIERGADPSKIAFGVPFYGRTFELSDPSNNAPGAPTTGNGAAAGPYTATSGFWGYNEIIEKFNEGGWTEAWDHEQQVPYAYKGNIWLTYDNPKSLALKVNYAKKLGIGGIMLWSLETEDFLGLSGTKYQLLTSINNALGKTANSSETDTSNSSESSASPDSSSSSEHSSSSHGSTSTTSSSSTKTTSSSTTSTTIAPSLSSNTCSSTGYHRDVTDCSKYHYCVSVNREYVQHTFECTPGTYYDTNTGTCNWKSLVKC